MARRTRMRDVVGEAPKMKIERDERDERSESPAEMRARHRRFKQNREKRQKRQEAAEPPPSEEEDSVSSPGTTPGETSPGEDSDDNKSSTVSNAPAATPDGQPAPTSIAASAQTTNGLPPPPPAVNPNNPPLSSIALPSTTPAPGVGGAPQSLITNESQTLKINTPITHSDRKSATSTSAQSASSATSSLSQSTAPSLAAPILSAAPSPQKGLSSVFPAAPSTLPTSSIAAISSATVAPVVVPTLSASSSSSFKLVVSSTPPFTAAREASSPTSTGTTPTGLGVNSVGQYTTRTKETNVRTAGVVVGVLLGALAIILVAWILIRKKSRGGFGRSSKKSIDWNAEKEPTNAAARPGSSLVEERIWGAGSTVPPGSVVGPGSIAGWPAYDGTRSEAAAGFGQRPILYPQPSAMPPPLFAPSSSSKPAALPTYRPPPRANTGGLDANPVSDPNPFSDPEKGDVDEAIRPPPGSKWPNWRNSAATASSLASVPRFRTIKSWVGDQRKRNAKGEAEGGEEVPDVPEVRRYSRLE